MKRRLKKKMMKRIRSRSAWMRRLELPPPSCQETPQPEFAEIYRSEMEFIMRSIAEYPDIETGGELFGFWKDDGTPVVAYAIGPGSGANHQVAFFNQDMDYLMATGGVLTGKYGLEHMGEWHSHHRLGLAHPSGHDAATIANGVRARGRNAFLLCIGTLSGSSASLGAFAFSRSHGERYVHLGWRVVNVASPFRAVIDNDPAMAKILVHPKFSRRRRHG